MNNKVANIQQNILGKIAEDNYELPLYQLKNIKADLVNLFSRYMILNEDSVKVKVKILEDKKFLIEAKCSCENFFIK